MSKLGDLLENQTLKNFRSNLTLNTLSTYSPLMKAVTIGNLLYSIHSGRKNRRAVMGTHKIHGLSFALSFVDDIPTMLATVHGKKSSQGVPELGFSLLEGFVVTDLASRIGKSFGEAATFSDKASAFMGATTVIAGHAAVKTFYEHQYNSGLFSENGLQSMIKHKPTAERLERALRNQLNMKNQESNLYQLISAAKSSGVMGKAIGATKAQSLAAVLAIGYIAAPIISSITRSLTKWVDKKKHQSSSMVYDASANIMETGLNIKHVVLEGPTGKRIKHMMDAPFYPESGVNPGMVAWEGVRKLAADALRLHPPTSSLPIETMGELVSSEAKAKTLILPKTSPVKIKINLDNTHSPVAYRKAMYKRVNSEYRIRRSSDALFQ